MAEFVLTNVRFFAGSADLTGHSNKVEITTEVEDADATTFNSSGWTEVVGGLRSTEISGEGLWEASDYSYPDDAAWESLGNDRAITICPTTPSDGDLAYFTSAVRLDYTLGGAVGDIAPWTSTWKSNWPLVRGVSAHPPGTARTATGEGTGVELGAVAAGSYLYANLHVLAASGTTPTLDVIVESDVDDTFASPTTRITFDQVTSTASASAKRVAGAITDTWFRVQYTIGGTSPSYRFIATLGIATPS